MKRSPDESAYFTKSFKPDYGHYDRNNSDMDGANHPLDGVRSKLLRAEEHLETIDGIVSDFVHRACEVRRETRSGDDGVRLALLIPQPPVQLSLVIGDCVHNIRAALDHLVWQLVLANPPQKPSRINMFPICESPDKFAELAGRRLRGVPPQAVVLIEQLQPYHAGNEPLRALETVENIDKHRTLALTMAWASSVQATIKHSSGAILSKPTIVGTYVENGSVAFVLPNNVFPDTSAVGATASLFVAFKESPSGEMNVVNALCREWLVFVRDVVVPRFQAFFSSNPTEASAILDQSGK